MFENNINLNLYKTFYDVARYGSFSKAAEFTYSTQSAISKAIKKLENELKTQLFYRKSNGVELTENGKELLFYVEKSYGNLLTAERILFEKENLDRGKLSIGINKNIGSCYIFDKVFEFHDNYPNIEISLITDNTNQLFELLDKHKIDFFVDTSYQKSNNIDLKIKKILEAQYVFFYKNNTKHTEYKDIKSINDLKDKTLILPLLDTSSRKELDEIFLKNKLKIKNVLNVNSNEMITNAVKKDFGIGYVLYDLIKEEVLNGKYKLVNLNENMPSITINLIYNEKFMTNAPKKFIEKYIDVDSF